MSKPIFQSVFKNNWEQLPGAIRNHYANHSYSNDVVIAEGKIDITFSGIVKIFTPFLRLFKTLSPYQGKDIFTRVTFRSELNSAAFCFDREFHFPGKKPIHFFSRLFAFKENEVIEVMKCRIGVKAAYSYENNKLIIRHRGYNLALFGFFIPLPLTLLFGKIYGEEEALSDDIFSMLVTINHFLFGVIYEYKGQFKIVKTI